MEPLRVVPPIFVPLPYPGKVVKLGHKDKDTVLAVEHRLNEVGSGPLEEDGEFDRDTLNAVKLFQARSTDTSSLPLQVDGEIGPITWAALFGPQSVPIRNGTSSPLLTAVLEFAATQVGIMEVPPGSNRGPEVDEYVRSVGLSPGGHFAWCVAFIFFCFEQAAKKLGCKNPMIKTAGVLDHWNKAGTASVPRITAVRATNDPSLVKPGHIFVIDVGGGHGHSGLVERVIGGQLMTIEGNTNQSGSPEGIGVFRRSLRKIVSINKGFIDYGGL
jgi:hypothetical protein